MFQLKRYIKPLALTLSLLWLWSCHENDLNISPEDDVPEGMTKITFLIPDYEGSAAQFGTRAIDDAEEGYMSNLYIIAVKVNNYVYDETGDGYEIIPLDEEIVYPFALNPVGEKFKVGKYDPLDYHAFNVTLTPGEYRFGVVANVDLYLSRTTSVSNFKREAELNDIVLNFSENTPLVPPHLPMVCLPKQMEYQPFTGVVEGEKQYGTIVKTSTVKDNLIPIPKGESPRIYAHMNFLCSKVRYTILFDKTEGGISESFGNSWIRFNVDDTRKPFATKMRRQTQLITGTSTGDNTYDETQPFITSSGANDLAQWMMTINRYNWSSEGRLYPKSPSSTLSPWEGTTADWIPQKQKVWQGIVYLPENNGPTESGNNRTIASTELHFPYHTRINSLDDTPEVEASEPKVISLFASNYDKFNGSTYSGEYSSEQGDFTGLERNYFYDVVAQVINPDLDDMKVRILVSILPWHDIEQNIPNEGDLFVTDQKSTADEETIVNDWNHLGFDKTW